MNYYISEGQVTCTGFCELFFQVLRREKQRGLRRGMNSSSAAAVLMAQHGDVMGRAWSMVSCRQGMQLLESSLPGTSLECLS